MTIKNFILSLVLMFTVTSISTNYPVDLFPNYGQIGPESLYLKIIHSDIKYPDVVFAQAIVESAHFSSNVFKCENNLFGMKHPVRRQTLSEGKSNSGYATYDDWTFSVEDYKLWQNSMFKNKDYKTETEYLSLLGRVYAEDPRYIKTLKKVMLDHKDIFNDVKTNTIKI